MSLNFFAKKGGKPKEFQLDPKKAEALSRLLEHYLKDCPEDSRKALEDAAKAPLHTFRLIRELARLKDMPCVVSDDVLFEGLKLNKGCDGRCMQPVEQKETVPFMPFYDKYPAIAPGVKRALLIVKNGYGHVLFNVRTTDTWADGALMRAILGLVEAPIPKITYVGSGRMPYYQISVCNVKKEALLEAVENVEAVAMALLSRKELRQCPQEDSIRLAKELGMEPEND